MTPTQLETLRELAAALDPGQAVSVPAGWLRELLTTSAPTPAAAAENGARDLTVSDLAARYSRSPSTVRGWLEKGLLPGSYKLRGRDWRIPESAAAAFAVGQRGGGGDVPTPPRRRRRRRGGEELPDLSSWRGIRTRDRAINDPGGDCRRLQSDPD